MKIFSVNHCLAVLCALFLAACAAPVATVGQSADGAMAHSDGAIMAAPHGAAAQKAVAGERLGTQWGDEVDSYVTQVDLQRVSGTPLDEIALRYADKDYQGRSIRRISLAAGKVELSVQSDGRALAMVRDGGQYYVRGRDGQAYQLVYRNLSGNTYEIVASVDGLDVISGQSASRKAGGYVLRPHDTLVIEGFRKSDSAVASFVFSRPADAYAANTPAGSIRNTGIIGTVVYELRNPQPAFVRPRLTRPDAIQAFPADGGTQGYAPPPR